MRIEDLPKPVLCIPLVVQWMWLALRYRSLTLPSCLDPCIETGGLAGESKADCLAQIAPQHAGWVAPWCRVAPGQDADRLRMAAGLGFPLVAKPDIGWCGFGVRRLGDAAALAAYVAAFPAGAAFLLQRLSPGPGEAGLFYLREPGAARGRVAGVALRHPPQVTADGVRDVAALLAAASGAPADPGLTRAELAVVPPADAIVPLTTVASLRVGGDYRDGTALLTDALACRINAIAHSMPLFHAGRFDVRFGAVADLQAGRFEIIEVNGAGSEAIHLWDPSLSLRAAFAGVFAKQATLFRMGAAMRARGHRPVGPVALSRAWLRQRSLIARYPASN